MHGTLLRRSTVNTLPRLPRASPPCVVMVLRCLRHFSCRQSLACLTSACWCRPKEVMTTASTNPPSPFNGPYPCRMSVCDFPDIINYRWRRTESLSPIAMPIPYSLHNIVKFATTKEQGKTGVSRVATNRDPLICPEVQCCWCDSVKRSVGR